MVILDPDNPSKAPYVIRCESARIKFENPFRLEFGNELDWRVTPAAAIADKIIPRLTNNAGMNFALLNETGERCPVKPESFGSEVPNAGVLL